MKQKSHLKWSWIFLVLFMGLSILDYRFGILGFVCMMLPIVHVFRGKGKVHCSHYCPRGSFLGKFLDKISLKNSLPAEFRSKKVKNSILTFMMVMLVFSLAKTNADPIAIGFVVFRFMLVSTLISIVMGMIYKPRAWCQVCPMGHTTAMIDIKIKNR